ncbi:hypothetical protein GIB67_029027 [Kingdonia uniflora]|uniref:Uncharacterized protein n=1 Tax=Kingdonia uniflora TaxID=39325 RepID=A0A7J7N780_9MAGN|nr:hypothetical protein GIB67_029027 [Kingdonia uniflora]
MISPSLLKPAPDDELPLSSSKSYSTSTSPSLSKLAPNGELSPSSSRSYILIQVGLLSKVRSFQKDLDRITETTDTSSSEGSSYVLKEIISALLRHSDCWISCYSSMTILVAVKGYHKLLAINNSEDLTKVLQKLGSIPSKKTMTVEVLWTPRQENDTLSKQEMLEDYPLLRPLDVVQDGAK